MKKKINLTDNPTGGFVVVLETVELVGDNELDLLILNGKWEKLEPFEDETIQEIVWADDGDELLSSLFDNAEKYDTTIDALWQYMNQIDDLNNIERIACEYLLENTTDDLMYILDTNEYNSVHIIDDTLYNAGYNYVEDVENVSDWLKNYIDYKAIGEDLYEEYKGYLVEKEY